MFWLAFAIGAGVLWLFAQDQFNHPSWKDDDRLTRILSVPHLRGDRVRKRALFVYFVLLLLVYAIFVFFGGAIVAALDAGVASPQSMAGGAAAQPLALPGPAVPFAVSLAIVGIAPRIELLTRVEEKIRVAAHEMMGLPRGLLSSGLTIADTELTVEQIGELNVNPLDLEQFRRHVDAAGTVFGRNAGKVRLFEKRLLKLVAYKVWVIDRIWPASKVREPYDVLEASFATDMARLPRRPRRHRGRPARGHEPGRPPGALQALGRPDERDDRPVGRGLRAPVHLLREAEPRRRRQRRPDPAQHLGLLRAGDRREDDVAGARHRGQVDPRRGGGGGGLGLPRHHAAARSSGCRRAIPGSGRWSRRSGRCSSTGR